MDKMIACTVPCQARLGWPWCCTDSSPRPRYRNGPPREAPSLHTAGEKFSKTLYWLHFKNPLLKMFLTDLNMFTAGKYEGAAVEHFLLPHGFFLLFKHFTLSCRLRPWLISILHYGFQSAMELTRNNTTSYFSLLVGKCKEYKYLPFILE